MGRGMRGGVGKCDGVWGGVRGNVGKGEGRDMWGIKSVLGPHTSTHFPTSSPLPCPHPFPTRQHTSPLTPYTFPHPPLTSFLTSPHTPTHFPTSPPTAPLTSPYTLPYSPHALSPHILPHSFDYVAKLRSNSKSPIKFFTVTRNLKSCFGVGNVNFRCMKVWRSYHVAKLLWRSYHVAKLLATIRYTTYFALCSKLDIIANGTA